MRAASIDYQWRIRLLGLIVFIAGSARAEPLVWCIEKIRGIVATHRQERVEARRRESEAAFAFRKLKQESEILSAGIPGYVSRSVQVLPWVKYGERYELASSWRTPAGVIEVEHLAVDANDYYRIESAADRIFSVYYPQKREYGPHLVAIFWTHRLAAIQKLSVPLGPLSFEALTLVAALDPNRKVYSEARTKLKANEARGGIISAKKPDWFDDEF